MANRKSIPERYSYVSDCIQIFFKVCYIFPTLIDDILKVVSDLHNAIKLSKDHANLNHIEMALYSTLAQISNEIIEPGKL